MALKKTFTLTGKSQPSGDFWVGSAKEETLTSELYVKVATVASSKDGATAQVTFASDAVNGLKTYIFTPNMDGGNIIKQAYEHLKTLPEFAGAVDC
jgi:hypothetical protein